MAIVNKTSLILSWMAVSTTLASAAEPIPSFELSGRDRRIDLVWTPRPGARFVVYRAESADGPFV